MLRPDLPTCPTNDDLPTVICCAATTTASSATARASSTTASSAIAIATTVSTASAPASTASSPASAPPMLVLLCGRLSFTSTLDPTSIVQLSVPSHVSLTLPRE